MKQLYPFQVTGVDFLASNKSALLADQMGTGKTVQTICAFNKLQTKRTLIITPASVKYTWANEIPEWSSEPLAPIQIIKSFRDTVMSDVAHIICNYDFIQTDSKILKQLKTLKFDVLVCDEAHYLKNPRAKRTRGILMRNGLSERAEYRWMLTGTPVMNRPIELYPLLMGLRRDLIAPWDNWYSFAKRYCGAFQDQFGGWNVRGASNIPELAEKLKSFMLRRTKAEVLPFLPPKTIQIVPLDPIEKFKYSGTAASAESDMALGDFSTLRKETALAKLPACIKHIDDVLEDVPKIIVFFYHREVFKQLHAQYPDANYIYGGMTPEMKKWHVDQFQNDSSKRVMLIQFVAGGQGIDGLQKVCDTCIFVETSWTPAEIEQAIDRLHRIGQKNPVHAQFLVLQQSLEEVMVRTAKYKLEKIINPLTGGTV